MIATSARQLGVMLVILGVVGSGAALAGTVIVVLTGSEAIAPMAGAVLGAALGVSAGTVIGRVMRRRRTALDVLMQAAVAGGLAALTLWLLQRY
jgi:hypothetical protein